MTEEWRKKKISNKEYRIANDEVSLVAEKETVYSSIKDLPDGWKWAKLDDVCTKIGDIDHKMQKSTDEGYPYIMTKNLTDELEISFANVKDISEVDYLSLSKKIKPEKGDIIFPRYGTIGKNVLVNTDRKFLISYSCAILKPDRNRVTSKYLYLYTLSPKISEEIRKYTVETTQANVGIRSIKLFILPLASLEEQNQIVNQIESRLSAADRLEEAIGQSLQQSGALRQSILKRAFEGRLVGQDPGEKPAAVRMEKPELREQLREHLRE